MSEVKFDIGFEQAQFNDGVILDKLDYDLEHGLKTGIKVIDDVFGSIMPSDVVLVGAKTGSGKCLGKGTKVILYNGDIKKVEDLVVGDRLVGPDSKQRTIISLARGKENLYKIIPQKGDPWVCNESHILTLRASYNYKFKDRFVSRGEILDINVRDYIESGKKTKHLYKQYSVGIDYPSRETKLDPYLLGLWLGDGEYVSSTICKDVPVITEYLKEYSKTWKQVVTANKSKNRMTTYRLRNEKINSCVPNPVNLALNDARINKEKRIPREYLINSRENRLRLLAGIVDTDGYVYGSNIEILTKYSGLNEDIKFLVRSLGCRAVSKIKKVKLDGWDKARSYHRITITGELSNLPTLHKKVKKRLQIKDPLNTGFKIESLGVGDYYGFTLREGPHFLLGDFTVTHNTQTVTKISQNIASQGKSVAMYALEAEKYEIELRLIYGEMVYLNSIANPEHKVSDLNYKKWRVNYKRYGEQGDTLRMKAISSLKARSGRINFYYRTNEFSIAEFKKTAMAIKDHTDIIIVDHIHYFDFKSSNDNKELSDTIKGIRDIAQLTNIPIILVAHLRKESAQVGGEYAKVLPTVDDFHGSSDLSKIATKGFLMAQGRHTEKGMETLFVFPKFRMEGQATKYIFVVGFDYHLQTYRDKYLVLDYKSNDQRIFDQLNRKEYIDPLNIKWLGE